MKNHYLDCGRYLTDFGAFSAPLSPKVHLAKGGRSRCRYSSRPSWRVRIVPESEFRKAANQCVECARSLTEGDSRT